MVSYLSRLDKFGVAPHAPRSWSVISPDQTSLGWPQTCPARGRSSLQTRQVWCGPTRAQLVVGHLTYSSFIFVFIYSFFVYVFVAVDLLEQPG